MYEAGSLKPAQVAYVAFLALFFSWPGYALLPTETDPHSAFRFVMDYRNTCAGMLQAIFRSANPPTLGASHEEDNKHFIALTKSPEAEKYLFLHVTLKVLKPLNDRVFAGDTQNGKDEVNTARNLYRILFSENVMSSPELRGAIVGIGGSSPAGRFLDFKSKEWAFDPSKFPGGKERLLAEINRMLVATGMQYEQAMLKTYGHESVLVERMMREHGLVGGFQTWHLAGVAEGSADRAAFAARDAASEFNSDRSFSLNARMFSADKAKVAVSQIEEEIKPGLLLSVGVHSKVFTTEMAGPPGQRAAVTVLSREAIDIVRKVDALDFDDYAKIVGQLFKERLGVTLTRTQIRDIRDYYTLADRFSPSIRKEAREQLDISKAKFGKVSVDFAGQNVENIYQTMMAIAQAQATHPRTAGIEAVRLAREREQIATDRLDRLKLNFLTAAKRAGLGVVKYSGDDGELVLSESLNQDNWRRLFHELSLFPEPVSEYRIVHTPAIRSDGVLDPGAMSRETVKAEEFEKKMRAKLYATIPLERLKGLAISTSLDPTGDLMAVSLHGKWTDSDVETFRTATSQPGAMPNGYRIGRIDVLRP